MCNVFFLLFGCLLCLHELWVRILGYLTYGSRSQSDILLNYPETIWVALVRIGLSIAVAFSYPLQCHPCRRCLASLIWTTDAEKLPNIKFYGLTYSIWICSFIVSMIISDLGVVLALVGATGSTTISYILPGLFFYRSFEQHPEDRRRKIALAMAVIGCVLIPFAVTIQFVG